MLACASWMGQHILLVTLAHHRLDLNSLSLHLHAATFQVTKPTGPATVPRGTITKLIMANTEPIRANSMAKRTPAKVSIQDLKFISSCLDAVVTDLPSSDLENG